VIQPTAHPHGRLSVRLGIALDRDHVKFGVRPDPNHRHGLVALIAVLLGGSDLGFEDLGVEVTELVDVFGYNGQVVDPVE
jgi:hypothetical protein